MKTQTRSSWHGNISLRPVVAITVLRCYTPFAQEMLIQGVYMLYFMWNYYRYTKCLIKVRQWNKYGVQTK